tara:strand:- start:1814 stop:2557 length:744 start_codon:yes stop_codon:yes gene_type:complete
MAAITFHVNGFSAAATDDASLINHTAGSGLGFFGNGFGLSVPVGQYQESTFVSNSNGTASGVKASNTKFASVSGTIHNGNAEDDNEHLPNYYAPLNIRFTHDEAVRVQNCKLRIFDRNDIDNMASGVTTKVYEIRHPNGTAGESAEGGSETGPLAHRGRATHDWYEFDPEEDMTDMLFTSSPGVSGLNTSAGDSLPSIGAGSQYNWVFKEGAAHEALRHDWYVALSASPDSIGSKTQYGLYFTLEYL